MTNPFDNLGFDIDPEEVRKQQDRDRAEGEKIDILIHRVFAQNDYGVELLQTWKEALIKTPTASAGDDLLTVGMNEGIKSFIRNILITIDKVERND